MMPGMKIPLVLMINGRSRTGGDHEASAFRVSRIAKQGLLLLATLALFTELSAQIRLAAADPVPQSDPIYAALVAHRNRIEKAYEDGKSALPSFSEWLQVRSPAAERLFPSLRFAAITWSERAHPALKGRYVGLADGLQTTVGVATTNRAVQVELSGFGNYEEFGRLLATNRVRLQNATDARTVWEAFCELHFKHWQDQPAVKMSDSVWHLGTVTIDRFHYYFEVVLDHQQTVQSGKLYAKAMKQPEAK